MDKTRDLFLGMLGHDLRGPLSTISACAKLELQIHPDDSRQAVVVLRSTAQMKALLDDLVEYTRHRLGSGLAIDPASLQLDVFARDTLEEITTISGARVVDLQIQGDAGGMGRASARTSALSNLVFNALKYGLADTPIRVSLTARAVVRQAPPR